jgi:hypothetical protein
MRRIGNDDAADDFESMSVDEYIKHAGLTITGNPNRRRERCLMANGGNGGALTRADLQDQLDQVQEILENAYDPDSSREDLAAAIGQAIDVLSGEEEDEDEGPDEDDDDSD